jgi:hypothetical protein
MQAQEFKLFKRATQAATVLVWLLAAALGTALGLKLLDRSKVTPADAREVSLEPPAVAVNWASLASRFGVTPAAAAAPVVQSYKVLGVVLDAGGARAVMLPDQADAKPVVVKLGDKLPSAERISSITTIEVIATDAGGREQRFAVPKREEAKSSAPPPSSSPPRAQQPSAQLLPGQQIGTQLAPGQRFVTPPVPGSVSGTQPAPPPSPIALPGQSLGNLPPTTAQPQPR